MNRVSPLFQAMYAIHHAEAIESFPDLLKEFLEQNIEMVADNALGGRVDFVMVESPMTSGDPIRTTCNTSFFLSNGSYQIQNKVFSIPSKFYVFTTFNLNPF